MTHELITQAQNELIDNAVMTNRKATQPEQPAEPVAQVVAIGQYEFPGLEWMSADHSFRAPIGTKLYAHPDPRIAALTADLAAAQARIERYEALLKRCSDACKVVPVLVRNGEHISLPIHIEKAIEKDFHNG